MKNILQTIIFRFDVNLRGCNSPPSISGWKSSDIGCLCTPSLGTKPGNCARFAPRGCPLLKASVQRSNWAFQQPSTACTRRVSKKFVNHSTQDPCSPLWWAQSWLEPPCMSHVLWAASCHGRPVTHETTLTYSLHKHQKLSPLQYLQGGPDHFKVVGTWYRSLVSEQTS